MRINPDHVGRSITGRYTWRPLLEHEPDDFPNDSKYWRIKAQEASTTLVSMIGLEAYHDWCDHNIPDSPPPFDWRETYELITKEIDEIEGAHCDRPMVDRVQDGPEY